MSIHHEMKQVKKNGKVLCKYFIQQSIEEDERDNYHYFNETDEEMYSSYFLNEDPTVFDLKYTFPFMGNFFFRFRFSPVKKAHDSSNIKKIPHVWIDLNDDKLKLPVNENRVVYIKVLPLSNDYSPNDGDDLVYNKNSIEIVEDEVLRYSNNLMNRNRKKSDQYSNLQKNALAVGEALRDASKSAFQQASDAVAHSSVGKNLSRVARKYIKGSGANFPSEKAKAYFSSLWISFTTNVNPENEKHLMMLQRYWDLLSATKIKFCIPSPEWKSLGFVDTNPVHELNGILSLECLLYLIQHHFLFVQEILMRHNQQEDEEKGSFYPFSAVGVNLVMLLIDVLQLENNKYMHREESYWTIFEDDESFLELFGICFHIFNEEWKIRRKKDEFKEVLRLTQQIILGILSQGPKTMKELKRILWK